MFDQMRGIDIGPVSVATRFFHYSFRIINLDFRVITSRNRGKRWFAFYRCPNYIVLCFFKIGMVIEHCYTTMGDIERLKEQAHLQIVGV